MHEKTTPAVAGQDIDPSASSPNPLAEILSAIRALGTRMDVLEHRFEYLDRDILRAIESPSRPVSADLIEAPKGEPEPPHVPALALRSDGRVLVSVAYVEGADLSERERWEGIVLNVAAGATGAA